MRARCGGLPEAYLTDPVKIIAAWEGGMSFHGGLLGVVHRGLAVLPPPQTAACCRSPTWSAPSRRSALFFGRLANFVNGELWGRVTDVPWAMIFPARAAGLPRHPSQLYEAALEGMSAVPAPADRAARLPRPSRARA